MRNAIYIFAAAVGLVWVLCPAPPQPVPAVSFRDTTGEAHTFGRPCKPALLVFWISGCPYCERSLTVLDGMRRRYPKDKLDVVAVFVNIAGTDAVEADARRNGHSIAVAAAAPTGSRALVATLDEYGFQFGRPGRAIYVVDATGLYRKVDTSDLRVANRKIEGEVIALLDKQGTSP